MLCIMRIKLYNNTCVDVCEYIPGYSLVLGLTLTQGKDLIRENNWGNTAIHEHEKVL